MAADCSKWERFTKKVMLEMRLESHEDIMPRREGKNHEAVAQIKYEEEGVGCL